MKKSIFVMCALVFGLMLQPLSVLYAQTGSSQIRGVVNDTTDAVLPGVTITMTNNNTGVVANALTNEVGIYQFTGVQAGSYKFQARFAGFKTSVVTVYPISSSEAYTLDFKLETGAVETTIDVTGDVTARGPLVDTPSVGQQFTGEELGALPMVTGNILELLSVLPGYREYQGGCDTGGLGAAVAGSCESFDTVGGLGLNSVNATLNGISINNPRSSAESNWHMQGLNFANMTIGGASGGFGRQMLSTTNLNPELIGEVRLILAPVDAELGRGNSQVQIQTRAGTNRYTGGATWNIQNSAFSALQPGTTLTRRPWINRHDLTFNYGGPIIRNKTFFFANYNHQLVYQRAPVSALVLTDTARQGIFRYFPGWNPGTADALIPADNTGTNPNIIHPSVDYLGNPVEPSKTTTGAAYAAGQMRCLALFKDASGNAARLVNGQIVTIGASELGANSPLCPGPNGTFGTLVANPSASWDTFRPNFDQTGLIARAIMAMPGANNFMGTSAGGATGTDGLNTATYEWLRGRKGQFLAGGLGATQGAVGGLVDQGGRRQYNIRIDHTINDKHRASVNLTYQMDNNSNTNSNWGTGLDGAAKRRPATLTVNTTSSLSSRLVNEFRMGYTRSQDGQSAAWTNPVSSEVRDLAKSFLPSATSMADGYTYQGVFSGTGTPLSYISGLMSFTALTTANRSPRWTFGDTMTFTRGKHSFRGGAEYRFSSSSGISFGSNAYPSVTLGAYAGGSAQRSSLYTGTIADAQVQWAGIQTASRTTVENLSYLLSGSVSAVAQQYWINGSADLKTDPVTGRPLYVDGSGVISTNPTGGTPLSKWTHIGSNDGMPYIREQRQADWNVFFKDDFKITRRLTLNIGLRYDRYPAPYLTNGLTSAVSDNGLGLYGVARPSNGDIFSSWLRPGDLYLSGYGSAATVQAFAASNGYVVNLNDQVGATPTPGTLTYNQLMCSNSLPTQPGLPAPNCNPALMTRLEFVGPDSPNPGKSLLPVQGAWGPALGFSWQLPWFGEGKTSLRGGWQRTSGGGGASVQPSVNGTDVTTLNSTTGTISDPVVIALNLANGGRGLNLSDLPSLVPAPPPASSASPSGTGFALSMVGRSAGLTDYTPDYSNPVTDNFTISVTRTLARNFSLDTRYVYVRGNKQRTQVDLNTPNVYGPNRELFDALEITRRGGDAPLFDYMLQGLDIHQTGGSGTVQTTQRVGAIGVGNATATTCTVTTTVCQAGRFQSGSAALRGAQAANLANGDYVAVANFLIGALPAGTTGNNSGSSTATNLGGTMIGQESLFGTPVNSPVSGTPTAVNVPGNTGAGGLPTTVTAFGQMPRNACHRIANGAANLIAGAGAGGTVNIADPTSPTGYTTTTGRCFAENYFIANPQLTQGRLNTNQVRSESHSFQTTLTARPKVGLSFSGTFSFDKIYDMGLGNGVFGGSNFSDPLNPDLDFAYSDRSAPLSFRGNGTFELPIGPNKLLLGNSSGWLARVIERWQTGFIFNLTGGAPVSVGARNMLYANGRPEIVGPFDNPKGIYEWYGGSVGGYYYGNPSPFTFQRDPQCVDPTILDPSLSDDCTMQALYKFVPAGTPGATPASDNTGRFLLPLLANPTPGNQGNLGKGTMNAPPRWSLSANASKSFRVTESITAQLRVDARNVMNTFYAPNPILSMANLGNGSNIGFGRNIGSKTGNPREFTAQVRLNF